MATIQKIQAEKFTDFSLPNAGLPALHETCNPAPLAVTAYTQDDIDTAYQQGVKAGHEKCKREEQETIGHHQNALIERLCSTLHTSFLPIKHENEQSIKALHEASINTLLEFVSGLGLKILPQTVEKMLAPIIEMQNVKSNIFKNIKICLHTDNIKFCKEHLTPILQKQLPGVDIEFYALNSLQTGDCLIEWQDGSLCINNQLTLNHLRHVFNQQYCMVQEQDLL